MYEILENALPYLLANTVAAVVMGALAMLMRRYGKALTEERLSTIAGFAWTAWFAVALFVSKITYALVTGENFWMTRRRSGSVSIHENYQRFIDELVFDILFAAMAVVVAVRMHAMVAYNRRVDVEPARKVVYNAKQLCIIGWAFVLSVEVLIYWRLGR